MADGFKIGEEGKEKKEKRRKRKEKDRMVWKNKSISNHIHQTNASFEADPLALFSTTICVRGPKMI